MRALPPTALLLGLAGLIPFLGCGALAVARADPEATSRATLALTAYGAVILAFLGGVHWGFVLSPASSPAPAAAARLVFGVIPSLIGWLALTAGFIAPVDTGLMLLVAGFVATVAVEASWRRRGWVPSGYMMLRWGLSAVVILTLACVLTMRLTGTSIAW